MTVPTTYPVYDTYGEALIRTIGSFWYYYFGDRNILTEQRTTGSTVS